MLRVTELIYDAASAPDGQHVKGRTENTTHRCGDFQGGTFYPLQAVEVRKYLCIDKWSSNTTRGNESSSQSTSGVIYSQSAWGAIRDKSKCSLHGQPGTDDVIDKERLETAWKFLSQVHGKKARIRKGSPAVLRRYRESRCAPRRMSRTGSPQRDDRSLQRRSVSVACPM